MYDRGYVLPANAGSCGKLRPGHSTLSEYNLNLVSVQLQINHLQFAKRLSTEYSNTRLANCQELFIIFLTNGYYGAIVAVSVKAGGERMVETTGDRIKACRREKGLTQGELGEMVGLSTTAIMRYEKNMREPKAQAFHAIAEVLGVSEDYLLCRTDDPTPQDTTVESAFVSSERAIIFRERLSAYLKTFDSEDIFEVYGTYKPYEDLLTGERNASFADVVNIAEELGLSTRYLLGETGDPLPTLNELAQRASVDPDEVDVVKAFEQWRNMDDKYLLSHRHSISKQSEESTKKALKLLSDLVLDICHDEKVTTEAQQLYEKEFMPIRIGHVIDFITANRKFLKQNMPGMLPVDNEK